MPKDKRRKSKRVTENMEPVATQTGTARFLRIDFMSLAGSQECRIAAGGVTVHREGIQFTKIDFLVPNSDIELALGLRGQQLDYHPGDFPAPLLTGKIAREIGYAVNEKDSAFITKALPLSLLGKHTPIKHWMTKMQKRVFFSKRPSSTIAAIVQVLYSIWKGPHLLLGHWKMAMHNAGRGDNDSSFYLVMGHVLRNSPAYQKTLSSQQRHNRNTRASVQRNTEDCRTEATVQRDSAKLHESDAEDDTREDTTLRTSDNEDETSEPINTGDASPKGEIEGSNLFRTGKIQDLLSRTGDSTPDVKLFREMRDALQDGLEEVIRLATVVEQADNSYTEQSKDLQLAMDGLDQSTKDRQAEETRREASEKCLQEVQRSMNELAKKSDEIIKTKDAKFMSLELENKKLKVYAERQLATMDRRRIEMDGEFEQMKAAKEGRDREVARLKVEAERRLATMDRRRIEMDGEFEQLKAAKEGSDREVARLKVEAERRLATMDRRRVEKDGEFEQLKAAKEGSDREVARLKVEAQRRLATMDRRRVEKDGEFERLKAAKEGSDREVARLKEVEEIRKREMEELRSELECFKQKVLSDEFYNQRSLTPEGRRAIRSAKRRRVDSAGQAKFVDDIDKLTDQMQERVKEELQKELAELHSYRKLVEQTAREQFSMATTLLQPTDVTAEGYYQVINLLVDSYRVAMGIAPIKLSNDQWVKLLEGLPTEGKEVLPRMLWEQRLQAEHPEVCNVLLGGLFNLHACHLMSAQEWAMDTHQRAAAKIIKLQEAQPIPGEEIGRWKGLAAGARNEVQQRRGDTSNFLVRVDEAEAQETQIIGARRMRWVFREAGWNAEGQLECPPLDKLEVPDWAIDYKKPAPARPLTSRI